MVPEICDQVRLASEYELPALITRVGEAVHQFGSDGLLRVAFVSGGRRRAAVTCIRTPRVLWLTDCLRFMLL